MSDLQMTRALMAMAKARIALPGLLLLVFSLPASAENQLPRPFYPQQRRASCGIACARMVIATTRGWNVPEEELRKHSFPMKGGYVDRAGGTLIHGVADLLARYDVPARVVRLKPGAQALRQLKAWTDSGYPVIIRQRHPGHYLVLDRVLARQDGKVQLLVRNPANQRRSRLGAARILSDWFEGGVVVTGPTAASLRGFKRKDWQSYYRPKAAAARRALARRKGSIPRQPPTRRQRVGRNRTWRPVARSPR